MTMPPFKSAPVLLIGFNRPDFMAAQIAAVRLARPERLYIAVDGPRENVAGEKEACRQVRECEKLVDWKCEIKRLYRSVNRGCKYGVSEAITWFFENEPEGIILEDDVRPTIDFFRFATEMLERYRDDERIGAVCGFTGYGFQTNRYDSYHFSAWFGVWGWASWRRVWKHYDVELSQCRTSYEKIIDSAPWSSRRRNSFKGAIRAVYDGLNTWDYQLAFALLNKCQLVVEPQKRIVVNVGVSDARASHLGGYHYDGQAFSRAEHLKFPLRHPTVVAHDISADRKMERRELGFLPRGITYVGCRLPVLIPLMECIGRRLERLCPTLFQL